MVSNNGQYKLNVEAEPVKANVLSWIECLREQNKVGIFKDSKPLYTCLLVARLLSRAQLSNL